MRRDGAGNTTVRCVRDEALFLFNSPPAPAPPHPHLSSLEKQKQPALDILLPNHATLLT